MFFWNFIKYCMFCRNLAKIGLKDTGFFKIKKRPNVHIILFLENCFKKGQIRLIWPCYNFRIKNFQQQPQNKFFWIRHWPLVCYKLKKDWLFGVFRGREYRRPRPNKVCCWPFTVNPSLKVKLICNTHH